MSSIKLVCFDLDDTLITQNSWLALNTALGIPPEEDARLYNNYESGVLSYDDWMNTLLAQYKNNPNATRSYITNVLTKYEFVLNAKECVRQLQSEGYEIALISGGLNIVVEHVTDTLGITHSFASNKIAFNDTGTISNIIHSGDEHIAKTNYLKNLLTELSVEPHECACVGDGANDLEMFKLTGRGITFKGSPIEDAAWKIIENFNEVPVLLRDA